jgi:predicted alpha/beta-hydrolase family hydrolase
MAVLAAVAEKAGPRGRLVAGGKSMGGRIASQVAARIETRSTGTTAAQFDPAEIRGLVFLGYPLHPPGRPEQHRTSHWPAIGQPALFVQGSRDPFGAPDELRADLPRFGGATTLLVVEGGDHSLAVPRKSGRTQEGVYAQVQDAIADWVTRIGRQGE